LPRQAAFAGRGFVLCDAYFFFELAFEEPLPPLGIAGGLLLPLDLSAEYPRSDFGVYPSFIGLNPVERFSGDSFAIGLLLWHCRNVEQFDIPIRISPDEQAGRSFDCVTKGTIFVDCDHGFEIEEPADGEFAPLNRPGQHDQSVDVYRYRTRENKDDVQAD
jgi:hypothetical protein